MKKLKKIGVSLMVLLAVTFIPMISQAQLGSSLAGEVKAELNSTINTDVDTSVGIDGDINTQTNVNTGVDIKTGKEFVENEETELNSNSNTSLKVNSSGVAVVSSTQISSESDLDIFSSNVSAQNKEVANVDIESSDEGESEVKVVYRHKGKFLGFIPVTIKSTTVVESKANAEAEVHSKISWWGFLVTNKNYAKGDIESRIENNATIKANTSVNASAQAKAQVAEVVIAEITAHANAQSSINE